MIVHRDELAGVAPGATVETVAAAHVRPEVLEQRRAILARAGWSGLHIIPCRACHDRLPLAA